MTNRESLLNIIKETKFTPNLNQKIYEYFKNKYDSQIATKKMTGIIDGNLDLKLITDEEINDVIEIFGVKPEENEELVEKEEKVSSNFRDLHNITVMENQRLDRENQEKDIELGKLREELNEMSNKMDKLSGIVNVFKKYNIKQMGKLIEVADEIANEAYFLYTIEGKTKHENTYVIATDKTVDVVISYIRLEKR